VEVEMEMEMEEAGFGRVRGGGGMCGIGRWKGESAMERVELGVWGVGCGAWCVEFGGSKHLGWSGGVEDSACGDVCANGG
jgi:hypothetical protein